MTYDEVRFIALEELRAVVEQIDRRAVAGFIDLLAPAARVYAAGCGRSGLAMRGFAMRLMHLGKAAYFVGEATTPALRSGELLVVGSGSGSTDSLLAICEKAKRLAARIVLLTATVDSPMSRLADLSIAIPAAPGTPPRPGARAGEGRIEEPGSPRPILSRQPLATLFEQGLWLLLDSVVMVLLERLGVSGDEMRARHANLE